MWTALTQLPTRSQLQAQLALQREQNSLLRELIRLVSRTEPQTPTAEMEAPLPLPASAPGSSPRRNANGNFSARKRTAADVTLASRLPADVAAVHQREQGASAPSLDDLSSELSPTGASLFPPFPP